MVACFGWECAESSGDTTWSNWGDSGDGEDDSSSDTTSSSATTTATTTNATTTTTTSSTTASQQQTTQTPQTATQQSTSTASMSTASTSTASSSSSAKTTSSTATTSKISSSLFSTETTSQASSSSSSVSVILSDVGGQTVTISISASGSSSTVILASPSSHVDTATTGMSHTVIFVLAGVLGFFFFLILAAFFLLWRRGKIRLGICCGKRRRINGGGDETRPDPYTEESRILEIGRGGQWNELGTGGSQLFTPVTPTVTNTAVAWERRWTMGSAESLGTLVSQLTLTEYMATQRFNVGRTKGSHSEDQDQSPSHPLNSDFSPALSLANQSLTPMMPLPFNTIEPAAVSQPSQSLLSPSTPGTHQCMGSPSLSPEEPSREARRTEAAYISRSTAPPSYRSSGSMLSPRYSALENFPDTFLNFTTTTPSPSSDPFSPTDTSTTA